MVIAHHTVTGTLLVPGTTETGLQATVTFKPMTVNNALSFPADNITTYGPVTVDTDEDGTLSAEIPETPEGVLWQVRVAPIVDYAGVTKGWTEGTFAIDADTDWEELVNVSPTAVTPTLFEDISEKADLVVAAQATTDGQVGTSLASRGLPVNGAGLAATSADAIKSGETDPATAVEKVSDGQIVAAVERGGLIDSAGLLFSALVAGDPVLAVYGDSYTTDDGDMSDTGHTAHLYDAAALELTPIATYGLGGYSVSMVAQRLLTGNNLTADGAATPRRGTWPAVFDGLTLIDCGKNDNLYTGGENAYTTAAVEHGIRTMVALARSGQRVEQTDASIAYGGSGVTWTDQAEANLHSGGSTKRASGTVANATVTITLPGPGSYWLFGTLWDDTALGVTTPTAWGVTLDGAAQTAWSLPKVKRSRSDASWGCPTAYRVMAAGSGTHTVALQATGTSTFATFDFYAKERDVPPLVVVRKQVPFAIMPFTYVGRGGGGGTSAGLVAVNEAIDRAVAGLGNVVISDPTRAWNPATMIGADSLHPNNLGQDTLYAADMNAIRTALRARLRQRVTAPATVDFGPLLGFAAAAYDSFTRAAGSTLGNTEVGAKAWAETTGDWSLTGTALKGPTAGNAGNALAVIDGGSADGLVSTLIDSAAGSAGLVVRLSSATSFIVWDWLKVYTVSGGTYTELGATPDSATMHAVGDRMEALLAGSSLRFFRNGVEVGSFTTTHNQTATKHGVRSNGNFGAAYAEFQFGTK